MTCSHRPEDVKVTLSLRTTVSSPSISLASSESTSSDLPTALIQIHASIKHSIQPALPVTLSTWRTPLERSILPGDVTSPVWINSALTYFRSTSNPDRYGGPPELGYRVHRRGSFARNLREDWDFITIPSLESGKEVTVEHRVAIERLQFWEKRDDGYRDEVTPMKEERWAIGPDRGGLGTFWWRIGDLDADLQGKKFKNDEWFDEEQQDDDNVQLIESEGANGFGLTMEIENQAEVIFE